MKSPITGKEMIIMQTPDTVIYKGKEVKFLYRYWLCEDSGEKFTTTEIDEDNLHRIKLEYEEQKCL